jgi:hypothetical protein
VIAIYLYDGFTLVQEIDRGGNALARYTRSLLPYRIRSSPCPFRAYTRNHRLIGVKALELGYSVATGNLRHFQRIPGLSVMQF